MLFSNPDRKQLIFVRWTANAGSTCQTLQYLAPSTHSLLGGICVPGYPLFEQSTIVCYTIGWWSYKHCFTILYRAS